LSVLKDDIIGHDAVTTNSVDLAVASTDSLGEAAAIGKR